VEVVASLSQGRTAAAQCGLFTHNQSRSYLNHLVLPYLTSILLAACEGVAVLYTTWSCTQCGVIYLSSFLLLLDRCWFSVSSPGRFISDAHWIVSSLGSVCYLHDLIVLVRNWNNSARFYCFSAPKLSREPAYVVPYKGIAFVFL